MELARRKEISAIRESKCVKKLLNGMVLSDIGEVHNAARPNWPTNQEETRIKTRGLGSFDIEDNSPCQKQKKLNNQSITCTHIILL
jgi:hypothetical protein